MVRMLSGVVNSAKTASRRVWCGALSLGTLPGHAGTGWVTRRRLGAVRYLVRAGCAGTGWAAIRRQLWAACGTGFLYFVR